MLKHYHLNPSFSQTLINMFSSFLINLRDKITSSISVCRSACVQPTNCDFDNFRPSKIP